MNTKRNFLHSLVAATLLLTGCSVGLVNLTPPMVPTNPSGIYTLSVKVEPGNLAVKRSTVNASVVVDGATYPMKPSSMGDMIFDYDYRIPAGRSDARFYYLVNYRLNRLDDQPAKLREKKSSVHAFELVDRYPITIEAERAPVGSVIAVLGRGFSRGDTVYVGDSAAETRFVSANSLEFVVPGVRPGQSYAVEVRGAGTAESAGSLRVDPGTPLSAVPDALDLASGERTAVVFAIDKPAPSGGLYLNVTTDVPDSVIMPEIIVPAGARTVNVSVEGGKPGKGTLFIRAAGTSELRVPVTVRP